jgi:drug/metabolite transporter (DMT)-like permease
MVTALSAIVLGEVVGPRRWSAVVIGLAGAVVIIRPGSGLFGLVALLPLTAAVLYACYLIVTRHLTSSAAPISTHFFTAVVSVVAVGIPLLFGMAVNVPLITPVAPTPAEWGFLAIVGLISTVSHFLIILAYGRAPASTLAPITYFEIVGATILGYLVFGDFPDFWTWVGVAVIVSSGLYVVFRARKKQVETPATLPGSATDVGG